MQKYTQRIIERNQFSERSLDNFIQEMKCTLIVYYSHQIVISFSEDLHHLAPQKKLLRNFSSSEAALYLTMRVSPAAS